MPRRRKAFIDRSSAKTYQLVHRPSGTDGPQHALLPVKSDSVGIIKEPNQVELSPNTPEPLEEILLTDSQAAYKRNDYEYGEYGFPDDGYDYSRHFKTIGGGGGVFMDAITGRENPEAVSNTKRSQKQNQEKQNQEKKNRNQILLKTEDEQSNEDESIADEPWIAKIDQSLRQEAIDEIKHERKYNKDLDEVFAALDSEGELESFDSDAGEDAEDLNPISSFSLGNNDNQKNEEDEILQDDFIALAVGETENETETGQTYEGILSQYREPRLLDKQFEKFMESYDLDSDDDDDDDDDDDGLRAELFEQAQRNSDEQARLDSGDLKLLWDAGLGDELAQDLESLQIEEETDNPEAGSIEDPERSIITNEQVARKKEHEEFTKAEFEYGMDSLLQSLNRVTADEAFDAIDGLDGARAAIARNEEDEKNRLEVEEQLDLDHSDGHDSDLDTLFDEMYKDKGDKWDCETIISTYSNLENHPSVIDAPPSVKKRSVYRQPVIRLDPRTQVPTEFINQTEAGASSSQPVHFGTQRDNRSVSSTRAKGESKEEKKARKAAIKEAARERRALKSEMKKAFGAETLKQNRHETALGKSKVAVKF